MEIECSNLNPLTWDNYKYTLRYKVSHILQAWTSCVLLCAAVVLKLKINAANNFFEFEFEKKITVILVPVYLKEQN